MKVCTKCGQTKSFEDFGKNKRFRSGRYAHCRDCANAAGRRWNRSHRANWLPLIWGRYRADAKASGREFSLPRALFDDLLTDNCYYCGAPPVNGRNGIDRVDSGGGYTEDNVVTACTRCNMAKRTQSREEFMLWANRVARHYENCNLPRGAVRPPAITEADILAVSA